MPENIQKHSEGAIFDITKLTLSFLIVGIHTNGLPEAINPLLRIAVPLFFMMSSHFFFSKIEGLAKGEQKIALKKFTIRNLQLFSFWTLIWLIVNINSMQIELSISNLIREIRDVLFCDTFKGSWYIMAQIEAVIIIFFVSKRLSNCMLMALCLPLYILCCLTTNYSILMGHSTLCDYFNLVQHHLLGDLHLSFVGALIWVVIGKCITRKRLFNNNYANCIVIAISVGVLALESYLINTNIGHVVPNDYYFSLLPLCIGVFCLLLSIDKIQIKHRILMRRMSAIIYCSHGLVLAEIHFTPWINYLFTILICSTIAIMIVMLSNYKHLRFLKFAY